MLGQPKVTAFLIGAALALGPVPASAQQTGRDPNVATETQERRSEGEANQFPWDWLGLIGLLGLLGLRRGKASDWSSPR